MGSFSFPRFFFPLALSSLLGLRDSLRLASSRLASPRFRFAPPCFAPFRFASLCFPFRFASLCFPFRFASLCFPFRCASLRCLPRGLQANKRARPFENFQHLENKMQLRFAGWGVNRPLSPSRAPPAPSPSSRPRHRRSSRSRRTPPPSPSSSSAAKSLAQATRSFSEALPPRANFFGDDAAFQENASAAPAASSASFSASVTWDVRGGMGGGDLAGKSSHNANIGASASVHHKKTSRREVFSSFFLIFFFVAPSLFCSLAN